MKPLDKLTVPNDAAWASWLLENGATSKDVSLTLAKKSVEQPTSLNCNEAVEEALCHGWIDGESNAIDELTYMQRYTPRAAKSVWSKRNIGLVERLETKGRMQDAGRAAVESAKQDSRWQRAYSGTANLEEMHDLLDAIQNSYNALSTWNGLSQGDKSKVYFRLAALKTEAGRAKHIRDYVRKLELHEAGSYMTDKSFKSRKRGSPEDGLQKQEEAGTPQHKTKKIRPR